MGTNCIYVGLKGTVIALERSSGVILWRVELPGSDFVNLADDGAHVFALAQGEAFCLDARDGRILWHNKLKGFGIGFGSLLVPGSGNANSAAAMLARMAADQQAASANSSSVATSP